MADRVCSDCGCRYTPPTPRSVAALAVIGGVTVIAAAIGLVVAAGQYGILTHEVWVVRVFVPWFALLGVLIGIYLILLGVAELRKSGLESPQQG